ncbi:MAG: hypothetical protein KC503_14605 [Myxococcales bacterium]|nr:hypothetical protein [Myxococcales bacterium]
MLKGAIIGAIAGLVVTLVMFAKRGSTRKKVLAALSTQGPQAARAVLDKRVAPTAKISTSRFLDVRERVCALAVIGDVDALQRELEAMTGSLTVVSQVGVLGWLATALRLPDPSPAIAKVEEHASRLESEGGRMMALAKRKMRALADLAAALQSGAQLAADTRRDIDAVSNDGGFVQVVIWQALRRYLQAAGEAEKAEVYAMRVRSVTTAFE